MSQTSTTGSAYAGDVDSATAWARLAEDPDAVLIDVRTRAEWSFVGLPDLEPLGKQACLVEWQRFPDMSQNPRFVEEVEAAGVAREGSVYLLCRSGARSANAAAALTQAGFANCFNVADGFEGGHDGEGHRGTVAGWKAAGLPWRQA